MQSDEVRISVVLDRATADALDQAASLNDRTRSAQLRRALRQGLGLEPPDGWTPTTTSNAPTDLTVSTITGDTCPAGGQHTPKLAKSGSGVIGCPKCQMIKRQDGTWAVRS
jgi:hypothetical protein